MSLFQLPFSSNFICAVQQHPFCKKTPVATRHATTWREKLANSSTPRTFSLSNKSWAISLGDRFWQPSRKVSPRGSRQSYLRRKSRVKELSVSSYAVEKTVKICWSLLVVWEDWHWFICWIGIEFLRVDCCFDLNLTCSSKIVGWTFVLWLSVLSRALSAEFGGKELFLFFFLKKII